jgi:hypothetical protein
VKVIIAILLALVPALCFGGQAFDDGWKCGWDAGWKEVRGSYSYPPLAPYAPYPRWDQEDDFKGGYNAGFLAAIARAGGIDCGHQTSPW